MVLFLFFFLFLHQAFWVSLPVFIEKYKQINKIPPADGDGLWKFSSERIYQQADSSSLPFCISLHQSGSVQVNKSLDCFRSFSFFTVHSKWIPIIGSFCPNNPKNCSSCCYGCCYWKGVVLFNFFLFSFLPVFLRNALSPHVQAICSACLADTAAARSARLFGQRFCIRRRGRSQCYRSQRRRRADSQRRRLTPGGC